MIKGPNFVMPFCRQLSKVYKKNVYEKLILKIR